MSASRPIVLVHGAWHGAWCWAPLQAELDARGVASHAVDLPGHGTSLLPLGGLHHDAAHVGATLDHLGLDDAVFVGHSYGGAVITQACTINGEATRSDIGHLVYIAAFALDHGESVMSALGSFDRHDVALGAAMLFHEDATTTLDPDMAPQALYGRCAPAMIAAALPRLSPQPVTTMSEAVSGSPRELIESTYLRCLADQAVHPAHQDVMADRCAHRFDLDADHSPFASATGEVADHLVRIATT